MQRGLPMTDELLTKKIDAFGSEMENLTNLLVAKHFQIGCDNNGQLFHYTSPKASKAIIASQTFRASFIRSTSDPLEFAPTFVTCRDWLCFKSGAWTKPEFPYVMFKHFNDEAQDLTVRYYFISLTTETNNSHLINTYGQKILKFSFTDSEDSIRHYSIKCRYETNPESFVEGILTEWRDHCLIPLVNKYKIEANLIQEQWFIPYMHLSQTLAIGVKQLAFSSEKETRLVFTLRNPDIKENWRGARKKKKIHKFSFREYLPVHLNKIGYLVSAVN